MEIREAGAGVIVLKQLEKKTTSPGGIVMPQNVSAEANSDKIGVVCHIGSDIDCVKVGDTIAFSHNYANVVNFGDKVRIFIGKDNVLAILN
jgi:co-chaperonin GroES (HSP10)